MKRALAILTPFLLAVLAWAANDIVLGTLQPGASGPSWRLQGTDYVAEWGTPVEDEGWEVEIVTTGADLFTITPKTANPLVIDWGDGAVSNYTGSARLDHTYAGAGTWTVTLTGTVEWVMFGHDAATRGRLKQVKTIISSGVEGLKSAADMFYTCGSLTNMPLDMLADCAGILSLYGTWDSCSSVTVFPDVNALTNVTTLLQAWRNCSKATAFPDVNALTNVTTLREAWRNCVSMTSCPGLTPNATLIYVNGAFNGCTGIVGALPAFWNTNLWSNTNILTLANHTNCFLNCSNAANWGDVPAGEGWGK
jgi:hypothetical protein